jgi:uncharacterized protein YecA (UPF0149 family)
MGAIAEGFAAFAQPLLDQTDGSLEQMNKAFAISQLCFNLALTPEGDRESAISKMQASLEIDDDQFDDFRQSIIVPMIRRHEEMFPLMHRRSGAAARSQFGAAMQDLPREKGPAEKFSGTDRYAPCPCNSGRKYKFCCGAKQR